MAEITSNLGDLKSILINNFQGIKDPIDLARETYKFYAENCIRDEKTDSFIKFAPIHDEFAEALTDPKITFILCEAPRGSGKSSQANSWLSYVCSKDPNLWAILVAKTDDMAIRQLNGIEAILKSPEHQRVFGNLIPDRGRFTYRTIWNNQQKVLVRSKFTNRFPTFLAIGTESSLVEGMRSDIIVVDDLIDRASAMSPAESRRIRDWFWHMLLPTRNDASRSKVVILGTPMLKGDLYEEIREAMLGKPFFKYIHHPALTTEETDGLPKLISYWPERYPVETLLQIREEDYWSFMNQYMLERLDLSKAIFKRDWLKFIWNRDIPKDLTIFQGIDPNSGRDDLVLSDYLAMATVGVDSNGLAYLLDLLYTRGNVEEVISTIKSRILEWGPKVVSVEIDANQNHFRRYLEDKLKISLNPVTNKNISKKERLLSMSNHFIAGRVLISGVPSDTGDFEPIPCLAPFVDEWSSYPLTPHDDALDSVNIALSPVIGLASAPASLTIHPGNMPTAEEEEKSDLDKEYEKLTALYRRSLGMSKQPSFGNVQFHRPRMPDILRRYGGNN